MDQEEEVFIYWSTWVETEFWALETLGITWTYRTRITHSSFYGLGNWSPKSPSRCEGGIGVKLPRLFLGSSLCTRADWRLVLVGLVNDTDALIPWFIQVVQSLPGVDFDGISVSLATECSGSDVTLCSFPECFTLRFTFFLSFRKNCMIAEGCCQSARTSHPGFFYNFKIFFWRGPFLKPLLNLLQYCFYFMFWFFWPQGV